RITADRTIQYATLADRYRPRSLDCDTQSAARGRTCARRAGPTTPHSGKRARDSNPRVATVAEFSHSLDRTTTSDPRHARATRASVAIVPDLPNRIYDDCQ